MGAESTKRVICLTPGSPEASSRLDRLKRTSGHAEDAELIGHALGLYELVVDVVRDGGRIVLKTADAEEQELSIQIPLEED
jgi:hypothetical protein